MTFREWFEQMFGEGADPMDLSEEEYYEMEEQYNREMSER